MSALFSTLYSGGEVILPANCAGFRVEIFWRDIAACGATWYTAVPTMQQLLLRDRVLFCSCCVRRVAVPHML